MKLTVAPFVCLILLATPVAGDESTIDPIIHRNISYTKTVGGPGHRLTSLDVYTAEKSQNRPLLVWIHGGGWRVGDKANVQSKPAAFVARGFVFVSINYRLVPDVRYRQQAGDVAQAINFLHSHGNKFGGDPQQIFLMGHSAGAHLAALVTTDERYLKRENLDLSAIKGVVLLEGGGYDIKRQMHELGGPRNRRIYSAVFGENEEVWKDASPITHVDKGKSIPPFLILHVAGRNSSRLQSQGLAAALQKAGISAKVVPAANKTHATINRELGQQDDPPTLAILQFLKRSLDY